MDQSYTAKQSKFNNGEISSLAYGDATHPKYPASLRTCKNWIPTPLGALVKRSGSTYINPVKDESAKTRLLPFVFSDGQTFVLEFGNNYVRFYKNGQYVGLGGLNSGVPRELVTLWSTPILQYLVFKQVGNTITITCANPSGISLPPQDLVHASGALWPWTIGNTPLTIPAGVVTWGGAPVDAVLGYQWAGPSTGPVWNKGERAFQLDANAVLTEWICIQDNTVGSSQKPPDPAAVNSTGASVAGNLFWMPAVDLAHPAVKSLIVQTAVVQDSNGITFESAPSPSLIINSSLGTDRQRPILPAVAALAAGYTLLYYKFYRATPGGIFGYLNDSVPANLVPYPRQAGGVFLDDGRTPDYTKQPPKGTDPFLINGFSYYPSVVSYLDQRRVWAASPLLPSTLFMSKVGDLYNYDSRNTPGADTDALNIMIASEELEQIRAFVPMRRGLVMTTQGEWALAGAGGNPISRSSQDVKRQSKWGSGWLRPLIIGTGVLFNSAKSNMVRDLYPLYGLYSDIWDGQELSVMARHLFDLFTLTDWAFQSVPYPVVWAVRNDGTLLSLTYQHAPPSFGQQLAEGVCAWARHTTGVGSDAFESVCVVPEPPDDAVYVIVKRVVNGVTRRFVERMASPICPASPYVAGVSDVRYGVVLDCAVSYDGHNDKIGYANVMANIDSVANPGSVVVADFVVGSQIKIQIPVGPFAAADAGGSVFVLDPENTLGLGVVKLKIIGYTSTDQVTAELLTNCTFAQIQAWAVGLGGQQKVWGLAKSTITAAHLSGYQVDSGEATGLRGVLALADGDVQVLTGWAGGVATLDSAALVITVGIAYNADAALLDAYHPNAEIRNKLKNVLRMGFEVSGTRDMWVGKDFASLAQWTQRSVIDAYGVMGLQTGYFEEFVTGEWNKSAQGVLRHFQPFPAILTSVVREISLGNT